MSVCIYFQLDIAYRAALHQSVIHNFIQLVIAHLYIYIYILQEHLPYNNYGKTFKGK